MVKKIVRKYLRKQLYEKANTRAVFTIAGISLQELKVSFSQFFTWESPLFSFLRSLKYAFWALSRLISGKNTRISYSFTAEDRLIESLLKPIITQTGFYVDVGCNDPRFISNSFLFYRRGWKGICIDANQSLIKKHKRIRPRDKAICALISDTKEEMEFTELTNNVLSSADPVYINEMMKTGQKITGKKKVVTRTLTEILDELNAPYSFDFLSVDIEEFDLQALRSLDLGKYTPKLIITEAEDFDPKNPESHPIYSYLINKDYEFKGSILTNLYFMKKNF